MEPQSQIRTILAQNVESKIDSFSANVAARANGVSDARVTSFRTAEGLFQPYGLADSALAPFDV